MGKTEMHRHGRNQLKFSGLDNIVIIVFVPEKRLLIDCVFFPQLVGILHTGI